MRNAVALEIKTYCENYYRKNNCYCLFKAECDEIRYTYGCKPYELEKEGVSMELPNSTVGNKKKRTVYATVGQKEYIEDLLGMLMADLEDYTNTDIDSLTIDEASEIIDQLKDDVTDADAWED